MSCRACYLIIYKGGGRTWHSMLSCYQLWGSTCHGMLPSSLWGRRTSWICHGMCCHDLLSSSLWTEGHGMVSDLPHCGAEDMARQVTVVRRTCHGMLSSLFWVRGGKTCHGMLYSSLKRGEDMSLHVI